MPQHNTPQLRFPEFSGAWEEKKLGDIADIIDGDRGANYPNSSDFSQDGYCLFLNAKNVTKHGFSFIEKMFITAEKDAKLRKGKLRRHDIVLTTRGSIGNIAYYDESIFFENLRINSGMVLIRSKNTVIPNYLYIYFYTPNLVNNINQIAFGSAQPQLTVKEINKFNIKLPTLPEQQKIASFLSAADKKLEQLQQKKTLLEQYKKGMMQKLFSQQIRFKDDEGKDFPEWEEKELGEVAYKKSSNISANAIEENFGDYIIYGATGILKRIDFFKEDEEYISIIKDGAGVGRLLICEKESSVLGTMDIIKPKESANIYFLYSVLQQIDFSKFTTGSTIPHIYFKDYSKVIVGIPSLAEQTKIADFLTAIDAKIAAVSAQVAAAKGFKKGLLQQMFV